jgi:hypothetical protein
MTIVITITDFAGQLAQQIDPESLQHKKNGD